jgi:hypothetical protein
LPPTKISGIEIISKTWLMMYPALDILISFCHLKPAFFA